MGALGDFRSDRAEMYAACALQGFIVSGCAVREGMSEVCIRAARYGVEMESQMRAYLTQLEKDAEAAELAALEAATAPGAKTRGA